MISAEQQTRSSQDMATTYCEEHLMLEGDAMHAALALATMDQDDEFVLYERQNVWHVALKPHFRLRATRRELTISSPQGVTSHCWEKLDWALINQALEQVPMAEWTAYGFAAFEAASSHPDPGDDVLLEIMIPSMEAHIAPKSVTLRALRRKDLDALRSALTNSQRQSTKASRGVPVDTIDTAYLDGVATAIQRIHRGDLTKVILSRQVEIPFVVDMAATFQEGRTCNQPARSFLLRLGAWEAAGFSPERVLEVDAEGVAVTQPLAGTRALTGVPAQDEELRYELLRDPKEVFEHAISVRLAVEELHRIGQPDSTCIRSFMEIQQRGSVQHLASQVETTLADNTNAWEALAVVFPAITASGIPKKEALEMIDALEDTPRGLYAGAVLMASFDGSLDAALVLRSVYQREGRAWLQAGAGVVGMSQPAREHEETCEKLRSIAPYVVPR